jgi:hypothetical protein
MIKIICGCSSSHKIDSGDGNWSYLISKSYKCKVCKCYISYILNTIPEQLLVSHLQHYHQRIEEV